MPMIKGCDFPDLVDGDFVDVWKYFLGRSFKVSIWSFCTKSLLLAVGLISRWQNKFVET